MQVVQRRNQSIWRELKNIWNGLWIDGWVHQNKIQETSDFIYEKIRLERQDIFWVNNGF